jgi:putative ABC transport system permease protein
MLKRKMFRDIKQHKTQFISIFLMAFLGVYFFSGIGGEWIGLQNTVNDYYEDTNLADAWIYGEDFTNEDMNKIKGLKSTTMAERQLVIDTVGDFTGNPDITLHFLEGDKISQIDVIEGKKFDMDDKDGIWLDKRFADKKGFSIGDDISLNYNGINITKKIRGLIYSPEYVFEESENSIVPDFSKMGFGYLSYKSFPLNDIKYNTILINTNENIENYEEEINSVIGGHYAVFLAQKDHFSVNQFKIEIEQHQMMGNIFPPVFMLIAILTLMTTMVRIVSNQRTQIGTLKAIGFSDNTITKHYVSYGFWLSTLGSAVGLILGPLTLPYLFYPSMSSFYTLPSWKPSFDLSFLIIAIFMVVFSTFITYLACRNISKENPANSIRKKAPKVFKQGFFEKTRFWKKLSFNVRWNIRDASRNKLRSSMTIIGVLGCTALLISAFGMNDAMNDLEDWQYNDINHYKSKLIISSNASNNQIQSVLDEVNGETIIENPIEIKVNNIKKQGILLFINDTSLITPTDDNRNQISLPENGVSVSTKMAQILGIKKGDEIKWHLYGQNKWISSNVSMFYSDPSSQGIIISKKNLEDLKLNLSPTSILSMKNVNNSYEGIESISTIDSMLESWNEITESMMLMVYIMIFFAGILAIVVLYNLGLLSFIEIEREMATLKVIGFKTNQLRKLLLTQNLWFTSIGFLLGIPLGYLLMKMMMDSSGENFYFPSELHLTNIILTFVITFGLSITVNLLFSKKIKNIDMVESLKGVE